MDKKSLQKYVNSVNRYFLKKEVRLLTVEEQDIVIEHLLEVANNYDPSASKARDLDALLCLEATTKVCKIHPDIDDPTEEQIRNGEARISAEFDRVLHVGE